MNSLFRIFNILHSFQFSFSDFLEDHIHLIKTYKWRINDKKTVINVLEIFCNPLLKKASCFNIDLIKKEFNYNDNSSYELMSRPVVEINHFNILGSTMMKPQVSIFDELEKISEKLKEGMFFNLKKSCTKEKFYLHFKPRWSK
jgi:hypothetical protein